MFEQQAFALLEVKSFDEDARVIEGLATTPTPDRRGDILEPLGAEFTLPMPLLWQHKTDQPIGQVTHARVAPEGIHIRAVLAKVEEPGTLRNRLDEAWQSIKARLVRGLSIGFKPLEMVALKTTRPLDLFERPPLHIKRWHWGELSAVTLAQNVEASITTIKSAAFGHVPPRAGGAPVVHLRSAPTMKTFAEQRAEYETARGEKAARMIAIMNAAGGEGTPATLEQKAQEEYDGLSADVKSLDAHIARVKECEALNLSHAAPLPVVPGSPRTPSLSIKANVPKGTAFVRYAMALVHARGDSMRAMEIAKQWKETTPEVELMIKAAVAPGSTTDPAWAGVLVQVQNATGEFLELLRPATILGKIPGLRTVPFNTQVPVQTGGGTYGWVGQAKPKPVTKLALATTALGFAKAAGIIVITDELAKLSSPSAEGIVRGDMIAGMAQFLDLQFIDPAVAEVANVNPASITNGADTAASSDDAFDDLHTIASHFATNELGLAGLTIIMSEVNALTLGMVRDASGNRLFPNMSASGGSAEGINVIASNAAQKNVIALQPNAILYADEGGVQIDVSREASVIMDSAPPTDGTGTLTSFWQNNLVGLRCERMINWKRGRAKAVFYLTDAAYAPNAVTPAA